MPAVNANRRAPVGVVGLWHLGCVTAACLADAGNEVIGLDPDLAVIDELAQGRPPVFEPGLAELLAESAPRLRVSGDPGMLGGSRTAWVSFDTPVDDEDRADVEWVLEHSVQSLGALAAGAVVIGSS